MPDYCYSELSLIEAVEGAAGTFDVLMIAPGLSLNNVMYSEEILRAAVPLFEGVRSLARSDEDHWWGDGKKAESIIGFFDNIRYVEGTGMVGRLNVVPSAMWVAENLQFALNANMPSLYGFSIVAEGMGHEEQVDGKWITFVDIITGARFVDLVVNPGAGGQVMSVAESADLLMIPGHENLTEALICTDASFAYSPERCSGLVLSEAIREGTWSIPDLAELSDLSESSIIELLESLEQGDYSPTLLQLAESAGFSESDRQGAMARSLDPTYTERTMRERLLRMIEARRPDIYATLDTKNITEAELETIVTNLITEGDNSGADPAGGNTGGSGGNSGPDALQDPAAQGNPALSVTEGARPTATQGVPADMQLLLAETQRTLQGLRVTQATLDINTRLATSNLPQAFRESAQTQLIAQATAGQEVTSAMIDQAIAHQRSLIESISQPGTVLGEGRQVIQVTESDMEKKVQRLADFFDPDKPSSSFKEAYVDLTGDTSVSGQMTRPKWQEMIGFAEASGMLEFREAVTTSVWDVILADTLNRAMVMEYDRMGLNDWRDLCDVVPISDFRPQHRTRWGGYENLPTVAESAAYTALTTAADEEASYSVAKRGGTETLTLEAIANDDVRGIRLIPIRMGQSAAQTIYEFVLDFMNTNAVIYDTTALFTVGHANLTTVAFSEAQYMVVRQAMLAQTELGSLKPLGLQARHLWGPGELENDMFNAFRRDTNNDERLSQTVRPVIHTVQYWTDANNWYVTADPRRNPVIELGFWGGEQPQVFVQDNQTVGSMFTSDERTYKIRHVYGAAVLDYRTFQGALVA